MASLPHERLREILQLLAEEGPFNDQTIAQGLGGGISTGDVFETTEHLASQGWIEESEFAPGRWQITDLGREEIERGDGDAGESEPGAAEADDSDSD